MFGLFTKKSTSIFSPVDGQVIELSKVPDEVFSKKMVGDGVAVLPSSNIVKAPVDGVVNMIFKTNHAFSVATEDGIDVLVHVGIDTIELKGEGFERLVEENTKVKAGTPILKVDFDFLKSKGKHTVTPVLLTNMNKISSMDAETGITVTAGSKIITYTSK